MTDKEWRALAIGDKLLAFGVAMKVTAIDPATGEVTVERQLAPGHAYGVFFDRPCGRGIASLALENLFTNGKVPATELIVQRLESVSHVLCQERAGHDGKCRYLSPGGLTAYQFDDSGLDVLCISPKPLSENWLTVAKK